MVSEIKPVIDFGWMMSAGLAVTFVTSFLLFPTGFGGIYRQEHFLVPAEAAG